MYIYDMDPLSGMLLAQALGQAVPAVTQGITGLVQGGRANQIRKSAVRPVAQVPGSVIEATGTARNAFQDTRMPGQQYFLDEIAGNQATATRGAYQMGGSAAERQNAAILGQSAANSATNQLANTAAQNQTQDARTFMDLLSRQGDFERQNWEYNEAQPYAELIAAAQREGDASNQNIQGAVEGLGGAGVAAAGGLTSGTSPAGLEAIMSMFAEQPAPAGTSGTTTTPPVAEYDYNSFFPGQADGLEMLPDQNNRNLEMLAKNMRRMQGR